ncbi:MAG TPA: hypothetical protein VG186_04105 [Solirubrobacteraceae bacterium]|nr:hypothetical protein [Solirubrobacteraceae bacterium]
MRSPAATRAPPRPRARRSPARCSPPAPRSFTPPSVANQGSKLGKRVHLALTDPDSVENVPSYAHRFAGDFILTSQGDLEQIFLSGLGTSHQSLSVLKLSDSVDDTVWGSKRTGAIYTTDSSVDGVDKITGPFTRASVYVAGTPCNANSAPSTCPGPGFTANYLGKLDPFTGRSAGSRWAARRRCPTG